MVNKHLAFRSVIEHSMWLAYLYLTGNYQDLRLVRHYLEMALPEERFEFLMSDVNQVGITSLLSVWIVACNA